MSQVEIKTDRGPGVPSVIKMDLPSNSKKRSVDPKPPVEGKKVEKVIKGKAVVQKKSLGRKFMNLFVGEEVDNVGEYIIQDVIVPAVKNMLSDAVTGGIEMMLFGERRASNIKRSGGKSFVNYGGYSQGTTRTRTATVRNTSRHQFDDIKLESRGEAEEVLSHLVALVDQYESASVADLYDLVDIKSEFTDNKYGWTNLSTAHVSRVRDGYILVLPKTQLID